MESDQGGYWKRALSRRRVLRGSAAVALGGVSAALIGCGSSNNSTSTPAASGGGTAAASNPSLATGTPPPNVGNTGPAKGMSPQEVAANIGQKYPIIGQYNWTKLNWTPPSVRGGSLQYGIGTSPPTWDLPNVGTGTPGVPYYNGLYRARMEPGSNLWGQEFGPDLAQTTEANPDYTEWVFTIPQNVMFHDLAPVNGRQMTAEDVVYSLDVYRNKSVWSTPLAAIDSITAVDDHTVKFKMKSSYFALPNILGMPYYLIFAKEHFEGDQNRWRTQPIGTGAFQMQEYKTGERIHSVRHPKYWEKDAAGQQLPYLDEMTGLVFADANARNAAYRVGKIDWIDLESDSQTFKDLVKSNGDGQFTVQPHWATYQWGLIWQWDNPLYKDDRVRRALSMAVDRQGMVNGMLATYGTPYSPVPFDQQGLDGPLGWNDLPASAQHDPKQAKQLLDAAGHGSDLNLTVIEPNYLTPATDFSVLVQQNWKDVGVTLNIEQKDYLTFTNTLYKKQFNDLAYFGGIAGFDADVVVRPLFYPGASSNWGNVDDQKVTDMLDKLHTATDVPTRQDLAKQINTQLMENADQLFLVGYHTFEVEQKWVHTIAHSLYTQIGNWGGANWKFVKLDETAPNGRGGKKV